MSISMSSPYSYRRAERCARSSGPSQEVLGAVVQARAGDVVPTARRTIVRIVEDPHVPGLHVVERRNGARGRDRTLRDPFVPVAAEREGDAIAGHGADLLEVVARPRGERDEHAATSRQARPDDVSLHGTASVVRPSF